MIEVTMTEVVTYQAEYSLEEFAKLVGCEPSEVRTLVDDPDQYSGDYGIEGAHGLLDDMVERHLDNVSERDWTISVGSETEEVSANG